MMEFILPALIGLLVTRQAFAEGRVRKNWEIIKQYRIVHFVTNLPVIILVFVVATTLMAYVPFMDKNPILFVISKLFGGSGESSGNIAFSGIQWMWYAVIFLPILLFALPSYAKYEEETFRDETTDWGHGIKRSIRFGLMHLIVFIPLGSALALSIGGLWFTRQYFKGGVKRSTVYHSVYNTILVSFLLVVILLA